MRSKLAAILLVAVMVAASAVMAQDHASDVTDMQALRTSVKADKKAFVASTLGLTEVEAKKFWPLYDQYQRALDRTNRQRTLVAEDLLDLQKPLSDPYARTLAAELIAADETEIKARRKLQNALMRALPPKKAARYLQLESKIRAYQAYDIAAAFPLVR